jgi:hypothetical protein
MKGRIYFEGNPWPEGHEIRQFRWSAECRGTDVWFGFHLVTAEYYEERDIDDDEENENSSDWEASIAWGNYHRCIISSDEWHTGGFLACPVAEYTAEQIDQAEFHVDPLPLDIADDYEKRAFHIYLLGHDAVADHHVRFSRNAETNLFDIAWGGKIALAYVGDYEPKYSFRAEITGVPFPLLGDAESAR